LDLDLWLDSVVGECALLERPADLLRLLPDLTGDAPVLMSMSLADEQQTVEWGFPVRFSHPLRAVLAPFLLKHLEEFLQGNQRERPDMLSPEKLGREPLVACLVGLLGEASMHGPRCTSSVLLEVARQSSLLLVGDEQEISEAAGAGSVGLEAQTKALNALEPTKKGEVLGGVAYALCARLSAAMQVAQQFNGAVQPTRLYQALVKNKMALVVPGQEFDADALLPVAAAIHGVEVDEKLLVGLHHAVRAAAMEGLSGKGGAQAVFRALAQGRTGVDLLALEPTIASWALHGLSGLVGTRQLKKAGVSGGQAKSILRGDGTGSAVAL